LEGYRLLIIYMLLGRVSTSRWVEYAEEEFVHILLEILYI
jgi:hypothetical protein